MTESFFLFRPFNFCLVHSNENPRKIINFLKTFLPNQLGKQKNGVWSLKGTKY